MDNALKNILLIIAIIVVLAVGVAAIYFVASSNDTIGDFVNVDDNTDNQVEDDRFDELDQMNQDLLDQIEALRKEREDALEEIRNQQNQDSTTDDTMDDEPMTEDEYNLCLSEVSSADSNSKFPQKKILKI